MSETRFLWAPNIIFRSRTNPRQAILVHWRPEKSSTGHFGNRKSHQRRSALPTCSWRACALACVCQRRVGRVDHFLTKALRCTIDQCNTDPEAHHSANITHIQEFYMQRDKFTTQPAATLPATKGKRTGTLSATATKPKHARTCLAAGRNQETRWFHHCEGRSAR